MAAVVLLQTERHVMTLRCYVMMNLSFLAIERGFTMPDQHVGSHTVPISKVIAIGTCVVAC